jgi:hypothetical protein
MVAREASQRCSDERRIELGVDELEMKSRKGRLTPSMTAKHTSNAMAPATRAH